MRRRSIGLKVNHSGLTVYVPSDKTQFQVESFLQKSTVWITKYLGRWENKKSLKLIWQQDAIFPLLGEPWQLLALASDSPKMIPLAARIATKNQEVSLSCKQIETIVMAWYSHQAMACFSERIAYYADKLALPLPQLRLSQAQSRWGSCNIKGIVRLNWRLIQMPVHLIDYVVAHELAHLIEMNHSKAFWRIVGSIYPDYLGARKELNTFSC